jgi:nucleoside-diphosphate-sugar epimerase
MSRVIVTGCAGFIGSHLCEHLLTKGYEVLGIDNFLNQSYSAEIKKNNLTSLLEDENFTFLELDLLDDINPELFRDGDYVINEAAIPGLSLSWSNSDLYFRVNTFLPMNILNALAGVRILKFVQISTSSVYGRYAVGNENLELNPISPYGVSKLAAEYMIKNYCQINHIPFNILRYFSVFGPRQRPDMAYSQIISKLSRNEPLYIFGDGKQSRTNTFVTDIAIGTTLAMEQGRNGEVYNLSGNTSVTLTETIDFIAKELGIKNPDIVRMSEREGDQRDTKGVFEKATSDFGYNPQMNFWSGLREQINSQTRSLDDLKLD